MFGRFRQDKGGRFILTKEGRKKLGLVEGPELAIDEEGFSRYDLADFVGEGGVSLGVGIAASIALGGVGALYALPAVGVAMGLGKLADEAYETAQGYQTQSPEEQQKDAVFEGVFVVPLDFEFDILEPFHMLHLQAYLTLSLIHI